MYILHYGVGHDKGGHSGRYPWGSGENPTYPKKIYGGVDTETKGSDWLKTTNVSESKRIQLDNHALIAAKRYMKKTGNFITEDEMDYIRKKFIRESRILNILAAGNYGMTTYTGLTDILNEGPITYIRNTDNEWYKNGKDWVQKYKYLDKYIY